MTMWTWGFVAALLLAAAPACAEPKAEIAAEARAFVAALNKQDPAALAAVFAPDGTVTDTLGAYHWRGPGAPAAYLASLKHESAVHGWTDISLAARGAPVILAQAGTAYAALPMTAHYKRAGKPAADEGLFVLSLSRLAGGWRITSATWALLAK